MAEGDKSYKIIYKNECTPQEQHSANGRYYLDSDVGRNLSGIGSTVPTSTGTLTKGVSISTSATSIASSKDFVYIKNTGSTDVVVSLTTNSSAEYVIKIKEGEAFASEINTSANVRVKTASGTSTINHYSAT